MISFVSHGLHDQERCRARVPRLQPRTVDMAAKLSEEANLLHRFAPHDMTQIHNRRYHRDDAGRVFLDYDPALFTRLLNWLRSQDLGGPQGPLGEVMVEAGQEEQVRVG